MRNIFRIFGEAIIGVVKFALYVSLFGFMVIFSVAKESAKPRKRY